MARINIEDKWWIDVRRSALIRMLKDEERADGAAVRLWRVGLEYWKQGLEAVPKQCFDLLPCASELLACALAEVKGASVYVKGASEHFNWINKKVEAGRKGGQKSVQKRRVAHGSAQPIPKHTRSTTEADRSTLEADSKQIQPSSSSSSSSSISFSNSYSSLFIEVEQIYSTYPRRAGDQGKAAGMKKLASKIKTQQDVDEFRTAVKNYGDYLNAIGKTGTEYVKQFKTFVNDYREWLVPMKIETAPNPAQRRSQERADAFRQFEESLEIATGGEGNE